MRVTKEIRYVKIGKDPPKIIIRTWKVLCSALGSAVFCLTTRMLF